MYIALDFRSFFFSSTRYVYLIYTACKNHWNLIIAALWIIHRAQRNRKVFIFLHFRSRIWKTTWRRLSVFFLFFIPKSSRLCGPLNWIALFSRCVNYGCYDITQNIRRLADSFDAKMKEAKKNLTRVATRNVKQRPLPISNIFQVVS